MHKILQSQLSLFNVLELFRICSKAKVGNPDYVDEDIIELYHMDYKFINSEIYLIVEKK